MQAVNLSAVVRYAAFLNGDRLWDSLLVCAGSATGVTSLRCDVCDDDKLVVYKLIDNVPVEYEVFLLLKTSANMQLRFRKTEHFMVTKAETFALSAVAFCRSLF